MKERPEKDSVTAGVIVVRHPATGKRKEKKLGKK